MVRVDHAADVLGLGDIGGSEAEHAHDAVACCGRHGGVLLELARDVLAEVVGRPLGEVGPDYGQRRRQLVGLGQLGHRRQQQAAGQIAGRSEQDHALDHGVTPFSARPGSSVHRGDGLAGHSGAAAEDRARQRLVGAVLGVDQRRRDVEVAAVVAAEGHRGGVRRRQLDDAVERAIGAVAVDRTGTAHGDPEHAVIVDGLAVRPELLAAEIEEPPPSADGTRHRLEVEDIDDAERSVSEVEPPLRLIERGPVGDRQAVDHTGHPVAVDAVQGRIARPLVVGHGAHPDPSAAVDLRIVGAVLGLVLLDRNPQVQGAAAAVEQRQALRAGHHRVARRAEHHATGLPGGAPGKVPGGLRIRAMHPLSGDVHPPQARGRGVPHRALRVLRPHVKHDLYRGVAHAAGLDQTWGRAPSARSLSCGRCRDSSCAFSCLISRRS